MRKAGFFPRLALVNLVRNRRYYGPYLMACGATAAMYYILRFLAWNEVIQTVRGSVYLRSMMGIGCFVVSLFSAVLLLYANSFVMKRRQREFGVYSVLGLEKRHIARLTLWETFICAAATLIGGLLTGILLSKLILLTLLKTIRLPVEFGFSISSRAMGDTAWLFLVLFAATIAKNLFHLRASSPLQLLRSESAGEREPKTKKLVAFLGVLTLAGGYALSLFVQDPVKALTLFFPAVILVIIGTYCLFTAGSIALLKHLRSKPDYYYQTRHFTAVSGMLYRMKQNAVGLANICILACMVLVSVSGTVCLYLGAEDSLSAKYPNDLLVSQTVDAGIDTSETLTQVEQAVASSGRQIQWMQYETAAVFQAVYSGNVLLTDHYAAGVPVAVTVLTAEEYTRLTGTPVSLAGGEVLAYAQDLPLQNVLFFDDTTLSISGRLEQFPAEDAAILSAGAALGLVANAPLAETLTEQAHQLFRIHLDLDGTESEKLACSKAVLGVSDGAYGVASRQEMALDFYAMYGGFLFLGIFLGLLFLMTTVLIIYYKQISEGYEDQRRYQIMQQVGMTRREVRASVRSQILLVFFLPLGAAGLHITVAFPMLYHILELFGLFNVPLFAACTAGTLLVFCAIYALVFGLTAQTYNRIVS